MTQTGLLEMTVTESGITPGKGATIDTTTTPADLNNAEDRTLVGRAADGDVRAFSVLVRRHSPILRAYARRILGSTDDVDDVVQETFIAAWQQLHTISDPAMIRSWLMRTASHKSIDRIRARREHVDITANEPEAPPEHTPERTAIANSREDALSQVLSRLPPQQRECWTLKELSGLSYDDIASAMGIPTSTVRGLLARARRTVVSDMEAWR
ncbi:RNA polymerase sigma factor [Salinibacterium sp.]|uniref:RNA polymerase sigma factor n=1 Tax=Salinibacterium sp. TaxID=1915057 RepID=UPI00286D543A|nr:RNA polymerase sigma factor [Salinibacterium sp.]